MSRVKANPKQPSGYPGMLNTFEKMRHQNFVKSTLSTRRENMSYKSLNSKMVQMFSGKRGK